MNRNVRIFLLLGAVLGLLFSIHPLAAQSPGFAVTGTASADTVCLRVENTCQSPELRVFRNGLFRHATPESQETCFIEEDLAPGTYRYDVEAVCPDRGAETGSAVVSIQRPSLRVSDLRLGGSHVEAGGKLVIEGDFSGTVSSLQLDASPLDSGYTPGAVQTTISSDRFRLVYSISPDNSRATGVYPVRLQIYDGQQQLADERTVEVTYLPEGRSPLNFPGGTYVAKDLLDDPEPRPGLAIRSIERLTLGAASRTNVPRLFDPGVLPPTPDALRITYSVPVPQGNPGATRIEIQDVGVSGVFRIPVESPANRREECTTTCDGEVVVPFEYDPGASQHLRVEVTTHEAGWQGSGPTDKAWSTECDGDPETPLPYCNEPTEMVVRGRITYLQRELRTHPTDFSHWLEPMYRHIDPTDTTRPASYSLVKIFDECGRVAETFADENGDYEVELMTFCSSEPVQVWAYAYGAPIQGNDVAVGVWTAEGKPTPTELGDLTKNNDDYTVPTGLVGSFVPDTDYPGAGGLTLDRHFTLGEIGPLFAKGKFSRPGELARGLGLMRSTRRVLDYMAELVDVSKLGRINLVLTDEPLQGNNNTAAYFPGQHAMIYIPPRGEFSVFVPFHEVFHYFDDVTLGDFGNDPGDIGYGRWSEPLANVRAAMALGGSHMPGFEDSAAENLDYNWKIEDGSPVPPPAAAQGDSWSQGWIWRVAWDLNDGTNAEPLEVAGDDLYDVWDGWLGPANDPNNSKLHRVILDYFPQVGSFIGHPDYQDRGLSGPDLVDLLDGMACQYGLNEANTGVLLHEVMGYDYLYDHCQP